MFIEIESEDIIFNSKKFIKMYCSKPFKLKIVLEENQGFTITCLDDEALNILYARVVQQLKKANAKR